MILFSLSLRSFNRCQLPGFLSHLLTTYWRLFIQVASDYARNEHGRVRVQEFRARNLTTLSLLPLIKLLRVNQNSLLGATIRRLNEITCKSTPNLLTSSQLSPGSSSAHIYRQVYLVAYTGMIKWLSLFWLSHEETRMLACAFLYPLIAEAVPTTIESW